MNKWFAALLGLVFGAGDQYLGSRAGHPWLSDVSLLSAPWLALPFLVGSTQRTVRRAIVGGSVATVAALAGYFVMTLSPVEGVHLNGAAPIVALLRSELAVELGGVVTTPLYSYLGFRWRESRAWLSALLVAGALILEPLATALVGRLPGVSVVWIAEMTVGVVASFYFVRVGLRYRRRGPRDATTLT
jgi:hypothetical protein